MSEVTRIMSKTLETAHRVAVSYINGELVVYEGIHEIGFSSDENGLLFLFKDTEGEIPNVIINTETIAYVEISDGGVHDSKGTD